MNEFLGVVVIEKEEVKVYLVKGKHGFYIEHGKIVNWFITKEAALKYYEFLVSGNKG